jgi:transposase-like protein
MMILCMPTRNDAEKSAKLFERTFSAKYPKSAECLMKNLDKLLTFYDFPAGYWVHLRMTNVIESLFVSVRHRAYKTKGCVRQRRDIGEN